MVTANSVKFSSVSCKLFPSNRGEPSRSTFDAQSLLFGLRSRHDCGNTIISFLSNQAPHKSSPLRENFKITFNSVLGHTHTRFVLMLVLQFAKSRDVTSLLKWVSNGGTQTKNSVKNLLGMCHFLASGYLKSSDRSQKSPSLVTEI